jgi:predicted nucleic acid-binding protein
LIFIDSNVFIYAVGRSHPLREESQRFFLQASKGKKFLVTSAEVLQELLHVYLPVGRLETLDAALHLATESVAHVIPVDKETVLQARNLTNSYPELTSRDLLHLAVCRIHKIGEIKTFDRNLVAAFKK